MTSKQLNSLFERIGQELDQAEDVIQLLDNSETKTQTDGDGDCSEWSVSLSFDGDTIPYEEHVLCDRNSHLVNSSDDSNSKLRLTENKQSAACPLHQYCNQLPLSYVKVKIVDSSLPLSSNGRQYKLQPQHSFTTDFKLIPCNLPQLIQLWYFGDPELQHFSPLHSLHGQPLPKSTSAERRKLHIASVVMGFFEDVAVKQGLVQDLHELKTASWDRVRYIYDSCQDKIASYLGLLRGVKSRELLSKIDFITIHDYLYHRQRAVVDGRMHN